MPMPGIAKRQRECCLSDKTRPQSLRSRRSHVIQIATRRMHAMYVLDGLGGLDIATVGRSAYR